MHRFGFWLLSLLFLTSYPVLSNKSFTHYDQSIASDTTRMKKSSVFQFFEQLPLEDLTITLDLDSLKARLYDDIYLPATLTYESGSMEEKWDVELKPRGRFRRKICDFPPIKIKFDKKELDKRGLKEKYNKLKIVTHCKEDYEDEGLVLREFLVYKLYNHLSDRSYRVRHFKIRWVDQKTGKEIDKQWAFFIENEEELAKRLDGEIYEFQLDESYTLIEENRMLLPLFQYMIGNHDHSVDMAKNVELVQRKSDEQLIVVPYDFDYSGVVNAPYTFADPHLKLREKRDRRFLGTCSDEELRDYINFINDQQSSLFKIVDDFKDLARKHRRDIVGYLKSYFEIVSSGMPERIPED